MEKLGKAHNISACLCLHFLRSLYFDEYSVVIVCFIFKCYIVISILKICGKQQHRSFIRLKVKSKSRKIIKRSGNAMSVTLSRMGKKTKILNVTPKIIISCLDYQSFLFMFLCGNLYNYFSQFIVNTKLIITETNISLFKLLTCEIFFTCVRAINLYLRFPYKTY